MRLTALALIGMILLQSCFSENNKRDTMDTNKNDNPVYSKTDSSQVVVKDEEWNIVMELAGEKKKK